MNSHSSFDDKERIRQAVDIVDLVGGYLQLRREGRGYKALCPWHDDSRPSLQVNPDRQSFKCWVCDIGGDIFSFIMKMENVEFREAMSLLADKAGVTLTPLKSHAGGTYSGGSHSGGQYGEPDNAAPIAGSPDDKRTLYQAAAWAEQQFHECLLKSPEADGARKYLAQRGVTAESIRQYHLGFAPDRWDWLIQRSLKTNFSAKVLERVGLLIQRDSGGHYDRFKGRVLFSIRDVQGRPVAVGGRILPKAAASNPAKYINSPESPLFSKSSMLYGLDLARDAISKTKSAIVMEGYTDCIAARQAGFDNVLAVLGTALGERHIRLLRRFAETIYLVLDGDEAGQKRTNEILSLFIAQQVDLRIVTLPDELDPCDFLQERGADNFREQLGNAVDALDHAFRMATRNLDIQRQPHEASKALEGLLQTIAKAPSLRQNSTSEIRVREWAMLSRLARMFDVDESVLRQRVGDLRTKQRQTPSRAASGEKEPAAPLAPLTAWDRELLEVLLIEPESIAAVAEIVRPEVLGSPTARRIFQACTALSAAGVTPTFERLLLEFDDPQYKTLLVQLDEQGRLKEELGRAKGTHDVALRLRELLEGFRRQEEERQTRAQTRALQSGQLNDAEELALLEQLVDRERNRQGISAPTDG